MHPVKHNRLLVLENIKSKMVALTSPKTSKESITTGDLYLIYHTQLLSRLVSDSAEQSERCHIVGKYTPYKCQLAVCNSYYRASRA